MCCQKGIGILFTRRHGGAALKIEKHLYFVTFLLYRTPETRFSEPRFSETHDLMNKLSSFFTYFALYPESI